MSWAFSFQVTIYIYKKNFIYKIYIKKGGTSRISKWLFGLENGGTKNNSHSYSRLNLCHINGKAHEYKDWFKLV